MTTSYKLEAKKNSKLKKKLREQEAEEQKAAIRGS